MSYHLILVSLSKIRFVFTFAGKVPQQAKTSRAETSSERSVCSTSSIHGSKK